MVIGDGWEEDGGGSSDDFHICLDDGDSYAHTHYFIIQSNYDIVCVRIAQPLSLPFSPNRKSDGDAVDMFDEEEI